jgi:hypothetical protein
MTERRQGFGRAAPLYSALGSEHGTEGGSVCARKRETGLARSFPPMSHVAATDVRYQAHTGNNMLVASLSQFDPTRK